MGALGYQFAATNTFFAVDVFHQGARTYGIFGAAVAAGGIAGNALVARRSTDLTLRQILGSVAAFGVLELICSAARNGPTFTLLLIPIGIALTTFTSSALVYLQTIAAGVTRSKLTTAYNACYIGFVPLGLLAVIALLTTRPRAHV